MGCYLHCLGCAWVSFCIVIFSHPVRCEQCPCAPERISVNRHFLDEADALADRVAILREGRLAASGPALALKARYCDGYAPPHFTVGLPSQKWWCRNDCSSSPHFAPALDAFPGKFLTMTCVVTRPCLSVGAKVHVSP